MQRKAQGQWTHVAAAVILLIIIVVIALVFTGIIGRTQKDVSQCKGLLQFGEQEGTCKSAAACETEGGIAVTTFSRSCTDNKVCCVSKTA